MTIRFIGPLLCGGLLLLAVLTPATAPAAPVIFHCSPTKVKGSASALDNSTTTSTTFVNIPEATVTFTQGGAHASCVIVRFSAVAMGGSDNIFVRAFLDQTTAAIPDDVRYTRSQSFTSEAHSFEFIFPRVAPGSHAIRMQFRAESSGGGGVTVDRHTTVVQFAP